MIMLIVGLISACVLTGCIIIALPMDGANKTEAMIALIVLLVTSIYYIIKGLQKIAHDAEAAKNGEKCYGMIKKVYLIDESVYNVEVAVYLEKTNSVEVTSFTTMFQYNKGEFLIADYYNRELSHIKKIFVNRIPLEIQKKFFVNETLKTTEKVTNYKIKPMDIPENGTVYAWENKDDETIK